MPINVPRRNNNKSVQNKCYGLVEWQESLSYWLLTPKPTYIKNLRFLLASVWLDHKSKLLEET